jgi:DNA-binding NtrC family response regulator
MKTGNVLVIDDELVICEGCRSALSDIGYSVDCSMTGSEGLSRILTGKYDLVLLDMKLPDTDGIEILRTAQKENPDIYVIIITGHSTVQNAVDAMKSGAFDYIAKPFSTDELLLAVERAMGNKHLVDENRFLREKVMDRFGFSTIVGKNAEIMYILNQVEKIAPADSTVLLYGESGTGKELFARAIHARSLRSDRQFIALDCSTLSPNLLESELFGHVKEAFTGAIHDKTGIFEEADNTTLFLDDIANLSLEIQAKLLRVLESREYRPVGSNRFKKTNVRIIAATNKDLKIMVYDGSFREDLFYRLNVIPVFLPPLRERRDDIPALAYHFLRLFCRKTGKKIEGFSDDALEVLVNHNWPGNVRELKNAVERLVIMADKPTLDHSYLLDHLEMKTLLKRQSIPENIRELKALKQNLLDEGFSRIERAFLQKALSSCDGNVTHAAEKVGMQRPNFRALMKKYHLSAK